MSSSNGLPARYSIPWRQGFETAISERLEPGIQVLDIGSGRHPAIPPAARPERVGYVGLDLSASELDAAGDGAYTEKIEADASALNESLVGRFDLVVSWQVLEHVKDLAATIENIHRYLAPNGRLVAQFSGSWSAFGVINQVLPDRVGARIVDRTMKRTENNIPVFPAYYDRCSARHLDRLFSGWGTYELTPFFHGASYFNFFPPLRRAYLAYENAICASNRRNLATHYLVVAER